MALQEKKKLKLAKELSDMVVYCKSVHFHGFEDARKNLSFYEMSSFKEGKALKLAEESGESRKAFVLGSSAQRASPNRNSVHKNPRPTPGVLPPSADCLVGVFRSQQIHSPQR